MAPLLWHSGQSHTYVEEAAEAPRQSHADQQSVAKGSRVVQVPVQLAAAAFRGRTPLQQQRHAQSQFLPPLRSAESSGIPFLAVVLASPALQWTPPWQQLVASAECKLCGQATAVTADYSPGRDADKIP